MDTYTGDVWWRHRLPDLLELISGTTGTLDEKSTEVNLELLCSSNTTCQDVLAAGNMVMIKGDGVRRLNRPPARTNDPYSKIDSGRGFFMTKHLFRNRWHRIYFQLLDAFTHGQCPLCFLLCQIERSLITAFLGRPDERKPFKLSLKSLCAVHKIRVKKIAADNPILLTMLKTAVGDSLRDVAHPHRHSTAGWRRWFELFHAGCPLCRSLSSRERMLCGALIQFLSDTEFWKGFQRASLLCLDHLEKCLAIADQRVGFKRLLNDQSTKLNGLLDDLIRFEATGTHEECKSTAFDWLGDFPGPRLDAGNGHGSFTEADLMPELASEAQADSIAPEQQYQEELLFENEKLARKVKNLMERLNFLETRAASLSYQVARLSDDNKRLEMGYTGANAQANGLKQLVQELRTQIGQLKSENPEQGVKAAS